VNLHPKDGWNAKYKPHDDTLRHFFNKNNNFNFFSQKKKITALRPPQAKNKIIA
jgi:hypothetical protein